MTWQPKTRFKSLAGHKFGRLLVLELVPRRSSSRGTIWLCLCDCGKKVEKRAQDLRSGHTVSCGCRLREKAAVQMKAVRISGGAVQHGHSRHGKQSRTYRSWKGAKNRCFNINEPGWVDYGGRGISMCDRWKDSFPTFLADMGECPPGMSLDRFPDNDGNYEPGNCRWATRQQQRLNQRPRTSVESLRPRTHWRPEERIEDLCL